MVILHAELAVRHYQDGDKDAVRRGADRIDPLPGGRELVRFADGSLLRLGEGLVPQVVTCELVGQLLGEAAQVYADAVEQLYAARQVAAGAALVGSRAGLCTQEIAQLLGVQWCTVYGWTAGAAA